MQLVVLGLNHKTAPVEVRERVSFSREQVTQALQHLYEFEEIAEGVILSTCNRTEIYAVSETLYGGKEVLMSFWRKIMKDVDISEDRFYYYEDGKAIEHLFMVTSGLDSLVVGEGQILSQVKQAYVLAHGQGVTGTILNIVFQRAIAIGKKVRSETSIGDKPVSVSYTAVNLAAERLPDIAKAKVLILGAGQMSELTAKHLLAKGVKSIFVSNRTLSRAKELAKMFDGKAISFNHYLEEAVTADILITSTGAPHYLISYENAFNLMETRNYRPLVLIDIAVPRDIEPEVATIEGISLFNIDALESVVEENKHIRMEEGKKALPLISGAVKEVEEKLNYLSVRPMMVLISEKAERIRKREVHRVMAKLPDAKERERRLVENMSRMLVRKLLRDPMIRFGEIAGKEEEGHYWQLLKDMFKLEKEQERP